MQRAGGAVLNLKANEPCFCGSGKLYKKCHKELHRTPPDRYLEQARKFYINRWVVNATEHHRASDYDWMIDQLPAPVTRLLDIGIGEGSGVTAIVRRLAPQTLIALEENPECTRRAKTKLAAAGSSVDVITRMSISPLQKSEKEYRLSFDGGLIAAKPGVTIVETDPLFDEGLATDLAAAGPFDVVTVWLMGSHEAREYCADIIELGHMTSAKYRIFVQNAVYELADKVLAVGGHLQIVDRLHSADDEAMRHELALSHAEQAEPTTLEVTEIAFREYREAEAGGVKMLLKNDGQGAPIDPNLRVLLSSVLSVKR
ncbi:SEC-C metal-binding domain-containing protein [Sphingomonas oryzagri]